MDIILDIFSNDNAIRFYRNNGDGTFEFSFYGFDGQPTLLYGVADLNADGILDVVGSHFDFDEGLYRVVALEHDGDFGFTEHEIGFTGYKEYGLVGDFFGTDLPDLIQGPGTSGDAESFYWENAGDFNFTYIGSVDISSNGWITEPHDHEGDGDLDFWSSGPSFTFQLHLNNGDGTFTQESFDTPPVGPIIGYEDMDGDGLKDIVMHNGRAKIEVLSQTSNDDYISTYRNFNDNHANVCFTDYNNDNRLDIIGANYNRIGFTPQNFFKVIDDVTWLDVDLANLEEFTNLDEMLCYDREGDGDMDVLLHINQYAYWLVNEDGNWTEEMISDDVNGWTMKVTDLDNDSFADVLV
ncbi:MAG: VCBS repeat-containing protein, partial [Bacteroidota bacterium]